LKKKNSSAPKALNASQAKITSLEISFLETAKHVAELEGLKAHYKGIAEAAHTQLQVLSKQRPAWSGEINALPCEKCSELRLQIELKVRHALTNHFYKSVQIQK
jgi:hypothetical protein